MNAENGVHVFRARLTEDQLTELKVLAVKRQMSLQELVTEILAKALEDEAAA